MLAGILYNVTYYNSACWYLCAVSPRSKKCRRSFKLSPCRAAAVAPRRETDNLSCNYLPICCALKKRCGTLLLHESLRAGPTWLAPLLRTAFRHDMKNLINIIIRECNYPAV
jgi:hypothetical protein